MPPKKAQSTSVYVVLHSSGIDSIHASIETANERATATTAEGKEAVKVEAKELIGGTIAIVAPPKAKAAPKAAAPKAASKAKAKAKPVSEEDEEDDDDEEEEAAPAPAVKKTKSVAEQKAVNAAKAPKPKGAIDLNSLPANVQALMNGSGSQLKGKQVIVTGVPPTIGRKNMEDLVQAYGAKLMKGSLNKKTDLVVVGNDAGPKK